MKKIYFLAILFFIPFYLFSQNHFPCGNDKSLEISSENRSAACTYNTVGYGTGGDCAASDSTCVTPVLACGKIRLPLVVHVIRTTAGTGGINTADWDANLTYLNTIFADANVEFYEASRQFIDSDDFYDFSRIAADDDDNEIAANDVANMINVYLSNSVKNTSGNTICGYAYYPSSPLRQVMQNSCIGPGEATLVHEMGHFFGLYHTHDDSRFGADAADNSTGCSRGDRIYDTGAEPFRMSYNNGGSTCFSSPSSTRCDCLTYPPMSYGYGCDYSSLSDCEYNGTGANAAYSPDMQNFMAYNPWSACTRDHFSVCQIAKIYDVTFDCRAGLCDQPDDPMVATTSYSLDLDAMDPMPTFSATAGDVTKQQTTTGCMHWYDAATGGSLLDVGATYTPTITSAGIYNYYVEERSLINSACASSNRVQIQVTVVGSLPVELSAFSAKAINCTVDINWSTATEFENDYFLIERSKDGISFETLTKIEGSGTTTNPMDYNYIDRKPLEGNNYYRLTQVDFDGQETISKMIVQNIICEAVSLTSIRPNPVRNKISIEIMSVRTTESTLTMVDVLGRIVYQESHRLGRGMNTIDLPAKFLGSGIYFVKVTGEGTLKSDILKFVKVEN